MTTDTVTLEDFFDKRFILDAVDFGTKKVETYYGGDESCQMMRFRLNGKVYIAIEDPSDGYRSCLGDFAVDSNNEITNIFPPVTVKGRENKVDPDSSYTNHILELVAVENGKVVLEVGTQYVDDYYPSFIANFDPTALPVNEK